MLFVLFFIFVVAKQLLELLCFGVSIKSALLQAVLLISLLLFVHARYKKLKGEEVRARSDPAVVSRERTTNELPTNQRMNSAFYRCFRFDNYAVMYVCAVVFTIVVCVVALVDSKLLSLLSLLVLLHP